MGINERKDEQGVTYYEARAVTQDLGGTMPMSGGPGGAQFPKSVTIRADSYWMIRDPDPSPAVYGDGTGPGAIGAGGPPIISQFPIWSCIGRWVTIDGSVLSDWFYVGRGTQISVPPTVLARVAGGVIGPGSYTPGVHIQYMCNDEPEGFHDNHGWLHIYESWNW